MSHAEQVAAFVVFAVIMTVGAIGATAFHDRPHVPRDGVDP